MKCFLCGADLPALLTKEQEESAIKQSGVAFICGICADAENITDGPIENERISKLLKVPRRRSS